MCVWGIHERRMLRPGSVCTQMRASVLHCSHARLFQVLRACVSECVCCVLLCLVLFFIVLQLLSVGWSGDSGILAHNGV